MDHWAFENTFQTWFSQIRFLRFLQAPWLWLSSSIADSSICTRAGVWCSDRMAYWFFSCNWASFHLVPHPSCRACCIFAPHLGTMGVWTSPAHSWRTQSPGAPSHAHRHSWEALTPQPPSVSLGVPATLQDEHRKGSLARSRRQPLAASHPPSGPFPLGKPGWGLCDLWVFSNPDFEPVSLMAPFVMLPSI